MANELAPAAPSGESNTPWWYETPSLVSQTTHMTAYTSSNDSNPFDVTPSVSSGYFDDEGSVISDGSYSAHQSTANHAVTGYHRTESNRSNSTLTNGRHGSNQVLLSGATEGTLNLDSTGETIGESAPASDSNYYIINRVPPQQNGNVGVARPQQTAVGMAPGRTSGLGARSRGIAVAPLKLEGEEPFSKAFMSKGKDDSLSSQQQRRDYENSTIVAMETGSPLSHSMSSANQEILRYLAPQFLQNIVPVDLLPHLQRFNLLSDDEIDYIYNPKNSEKDKVKKILRSAPSKHGDAFDLFVECFEADKEHQAHLYLAKRLREAVEKKRLYPFKRLASLRQKGHNHTQNHTYNLSWQAPYGGGGAEHVETSSNKAEPPAARATIKPDTAEVVPQVPPKLRRHKKTLSNGSCEGAPNLTPYPAWSNLESQQDSNMSQSLDPVFVPEDSRDKTPNPPRGFSRRPYDKVRFNPAPGNCSSLPRNHSQRNSNNEARGTKPYSSARYPSSTQIQIPVTGTPEKGRLSRNASFHGMGERDRGIIVSPMDRNPAVLSEETDDDSYLFRKASSSSYSDQNYENVLRRSSDDSGRQFSSPNYQNTALNGLISPPPLPGHVPPSLSRRMHGVILEDPSAMPGMTVDKMATFPRRVPSRSHSMRDGSAPSPVVSPELEAKVPDRSSSLRRRASLHGPADVPLGLPTGRGSRSLLVVPVGGKTSAATPTFIRQHRRTQSSDIEQSGILEESMELHQHRRMSEYYSRERGGKEEEEEESSRVADTVTVYNPAAAARATGQDLNQQKMFKKKIQWLQQKIKFKDFTEELKFDSLTRYNTPRDIIYSGTLYERGNPRFVILMTDMLLIIKSKKKAGRLGSRQQQFIDWFTDIDCKTKRPLMLHLLSIQAKSRRASTESFGLHFNKGSSLVRINLHAVSKEAKNIWLDNLADAIKDCTNANAECAVPVRHSVLQYSEGTLPKTSLALTIVEANNIAYSANVTTKNHYCSITLGVLRCRTPSVKAKCWPTWNFKCDFTDFDLNDALRIDFYTERVSCPDDFLGYVEVNLFSASRKHQTQLGVTEMQLKNQHLPLREGKGTLTVDFQLKWEEPENHAS